MDAAMKKWREMIIIAECENCPLGWEERGYEGECYDYGCMVYTNTIPQDGTSWCVKSFDERYNKSKELEVLR
jgi:hypothetical protein